MVKALVVLVLLGIGFWAIKMIEPVTSKIIAARTAAEMSWALCIYFTLAGVIAFTVLAIGGIALFL